MRGKCESLELRGRILATDRLEIYLAFNITIKLNGSGYRATIKMFNYFGYCKKIGLNLKRITVLGLDVIRGSVGAA